MDVSSLLILICPALNLARFFDGGEGLAVYKQDYSVFDKTPNSKPWSHLVSIPLPAQQFVLCYSQETFQAKCFKIQLNSDNKIEYIEHRINSEIFYNKKWSYFLPFVLDGRSLFLAYDISTGKTECYSTELQPIENNQSIKIESISSWGTWDNDWTDFLPFYLNDTPHFIRYKRLRGLIHFARINSDAKNFTLLNEMTWGKGWSLFTPFIIDRKPHFIAYNQHSQLIHIGRIRPDGRDIEILNEIHLDQVWTKFIPFEINGAPHFLAINEQTGETRLFHITYSSSNPSTNGKCFVTFYFPPQHLSEEYEPKPIYTAKEDRFKESRNAYPNLVEPLYAAGGWHETYDPKLTGAFGWPSPSALFDKPSSHEDWWASVMFSEGTKLCFFAKEGSPNPLIILNKNPLDIAALLDWSNWQLCLHPRAVSQTTYEKEINKDKFSLVKSDPFREISSEGCGTCVDMCFGITAALTDTGGWTHP